jgi:hypothetical protein
MRFYSEKAGVDAVVVGVEDRWVGLGWDGWDRVSTYAYVYVLIYVLIYIYL